MAKNTMFAFALLAFAPFTAAARHTVNGERPHCR